MGSSVRKEYLGDVQLELRDTDKAAEAGDDETTKGLLPGHKGLLSDESM